LEYSLETNNKILKALKKLLQNLPEDWINLTTHRLDIYNESAAKTEFLNQLKTLVADNNIDPESLEHLPTAYDYIRLGHQLSSVLEWVLANINQVEEDRVITFASKTMPILALLRSNTLNNKSTHIYYDVNDSPLLDEPRLKEIYGYKYQLTQVKGSTEIPNRLDEYNVFVTAQPFNQQLSSIPNIDATVNISSDYGSFVIINQKGTPSTVNTVQHVRRRETIAMSPLNCLHVLHEMVGNKPIKTVLNGQAPDTVAHCIRENTGSQIDPLVASSGLSIQYAILMGLVENAIIQHPNKPIRIILPPNCYGGTNDQSRRVADLLPQVGIVDLLVDGGADLVNSLELALEHVASIDGVPIVLAEIPTNPRVEVPDMNLLGETLAKKRTTPNQTTAAEPIFMVDQTFCPNVKLLHHDSELKAVKTISFSSGSKFPSGGRCIAGYCAANSKAEFLMPLIAAHLKLSDNAADNNQLNILAETMPTMPERIVKAYNKTREFVMQVHSMIPNAKIFYVNDEMAKRGFMPSVFSLDLPINASTPSARQELQKELNKKLIEFMINRHPNDCKNCVSYGQLKGSYWTIPATSTQGTTKEDDKDYVVRASISPEADVTLLAKSFKVFCEDNHLI